MTDYEEEQHMEIEAIQSIYPDEFTVISERAPHSFQIHLAESSQDKEDKTEIAVGVQILFTLGKTYPDEAPLMEVISPEGLRDEDVTELTELLAQQAEENLGMVMVFTIVSCVQEKLQDFVEDILKRRQAERDRIEKELQEIEKKKICGTPCTKELFAEWRLKFDEEMASKKKGVVVVVTKSKITGRKLFELDATLKDSDSVFFEQGADEANVEVDETLFQEIDDLELDDDEEFS